MTNTPTPSSNSTNLVPAPMPHCNVQSLSQLCTPQEIQTPNTHKWLWQNYIPIGGITLLEGAEGIGKTTIALDFARRVANGLPMPPNNPSAPLEPDRAIQGRVLFIAIDGTFESSLLPHLKQTNINLDNIFLCNTVTRYDPKNQTEITDNLSFSREDFAILKDAILKFRPTLIIADSIINLYHQHKPCSNTVIIQWLQDLEKLCQQLDIACLFTRQKHIKGNNSNSQPGENSSLFSRYAQSILLAASHPVAPGLIFLANSKQRLLSPATTVVCYISINELHAPILIWESFSAFQTSDLLHPRWTSKQSMGAQRQKIINALREHYPYHLDTPTLATITGIPETSVNTVLRRMLDRHQVIQHDRGFYGILPHSQISGAAIHYQHKQHVSEVSVSNQQSQSLSETTNTAPASTSKLPPRSKPMYGPFTYQELITIMPHLANDPIAPEILDNLSKQPNFVEHIESLAAQQKRIATAKTLSTLSETTNTQNSLSTLSETPQPTPNKPNTTSNKPKIRNNKTNNRPNKRRHR